MRKNNQQLNNWETVKLGNLVDIKTGRKDANQGDPDGQYPFFTCAQTISKINSYSFDTEAVLIAGNGDFNVKYYNGKFDAYQRTYVLDNFKNSIGKFIYYKTQQALNDIIKNNQGSSVKFIKKGYLTDYIFLLPPIKEQKKIAEILSTVDEDIEKTDQIIQETEKLKRGLMQELLSEKLKVKSEKLGNICDFTTGKLNSNQARVDGQYPFFTCSQETYKIDKYSFDQEAILLAGNNAAGVYSVKYYKGKFDAYQRTYIITIKNSNIADYIYLKEILQNKLEELKNKSFGSSTKFLTLKLLQNLQVKLPEIKKQKQIAEILSEVDNKIKINKSIEDKLTQLKKGLMQDLLSGAVGS